MTDTYNLKLTGATLPDRPRELAAKSLADVMRIAPEQALGLLSGRETIIKRGLDPDQVPRYLQAIEAAGVEVRAERVSPPAPVTSPEPAAVPLALVPAQDETEAAADTMRCPACGALQPIRTLCRDCGTDMPRMLAAQEEAKRNPPGQSPFAPPTAAVRDVAANFAETETPSPLAFSFRGRIGRLRYLAYCLPAYVPMLIGALIGGIFLGIAHSSVAFGLFFGLGSLATIVLGLRVVVLRLHDVNRSGWWILVSIPLGLLAVASSTLGVLMLGLFGICSLALLFWPGSAEDNDYGPPPGENTVWTTVGAIAMIVLSVAGNSMSPMAKFGGKSPATDTVSEQQAE